jgi:hypothetical protein
VDSPRDASPNVDLCFFLSFFWVDFHRRDADKHRRIAATNANQASTAMQIKASLAEELATARAEREAAFEERRAALLELSDVKTELAGVSREVALLREEKEATAAMIQGLRDDVKAKTTEVDVGALAAREQLLLSMMSDIGRVATQYMPSILANQPTAPQPVAPPPDQPISEPPTV